MDKKIALITGASRGLGFAMSEKLAELGVKVIMVCRNKDSGKIAFSRLKEKNLDVILKIADIESIDDIKNLHKEISSEFSYLDILINNAGVNLENENITIESIDINTFQKVMDINLRGTILMCKYFIPLLKKSSSGRIINFSSGLGQLSFPRTGPYPSYSISKTAVNAVTKILADELKNTKIMVFSVDPGWVKTDMGGPAAPLSIEEGIDTPVWLATAPENELKSGYFYKERKIIEW